MQKLPLTAVIGAALLALAYLVPGHYLPWVTFQQQWLAGLAAACIVLGAVQAASRAGRDIGWPPLALLALVSALVPWLQWTFGQVSFLSDALLPSLYLAAFGLCIVAGSALASACGSRWLDALFAAFIVGAMLSVAIALLQWLSLGTGGVWIADLPRGFRPFANLAQPNHLATLLVLGAVGVLRAYEWRRLGGLAAGVVCAWLAFGLLMAQSRAGWVSLAALAGWWWAMRRRAGLRLAAGPVVAGVIAFGAGVIAWEPLNEALLLSQVSTLAERMQSSPRTQIWRVLVDAAGRAPWFGYGWNQVSLAQLAAGLDHPAVGRYFQNAHNVLLDLALWAGQPFMLLWAASGGAWLWRRVRACAGVEAWSVLAAVGTVGINALIEFPQDQLFFLLPLGLLLGSLPAADARVATLRPLALAAPTVLLLGMLGWIGAEYLKVEQAHRDVRLLLAGYGLDKVPHVPPPEVALLDGPREYHRFMITPARPGMSDAELDWMRRVVQRNAFPPALMRHALAAGLNGRPDEAAHTLRLICKVHSPKHCDEARESWRAAQQQFAVLQAIPPP